MPNPSDNPVPSQPHPAPGGRLVTAGFVLWMAVVSVPMTLLAAKHWSPLPSPAPRSVAPADPQTGWTVRHVLVADCGCSRRLANHLTERRPDPSVSESVFLIGPDPVVESRLTRAGWPVRIIGEAQAETELGVEGGPFLLVYRPDGTPAYAGGHGPRPGAPAEWRDQAVMSAVRSGTAVEPLAVYGCGVSSRYDAVRRLTTLKPSLSPTNP